MGERGCYGTVRGSAALAALAATVVLAAQVAQAQVSGGTLDPTFDEDGVRVDDLGSDEVARGVALQPDGRIVVAGTGCGGDILVARYTPGGALDPTFATGGWVCVDVGAGSQDQGEEVFVLGDGRLLVAGTSSGDFTLLRLTADGRLDPSFDGDGKATYDMGAAEVLRDAALAPDGRVVLVGWRERPRCGFSFLPTADYVAARVNRDGTLDASFGDGGRVVIETGEVARAQAVVVQPDGAVVVGGHTASCTRVRIDYSLFRLTPTGAPDPSFASTRPFSEVGPDSVSDIALQSDGQLVVAVDTFVGPATSPSRDDAFVVLRFNPDGSADPTFGGGGVALVLFGTDRDATPSAVVVQPDGRILVGGSVRPRFGAPGDSDFALARLNPDGTPDSTFGDGGRLVTDIGGDDLLHALALQPDLKAVAAGSSDGDVALARYVLGPGGSRRAGGVAAGMASVGA